jgi:hypothetical protein
LPVDALGARLTLATIRSTWRCSAWQLRYRRGNLCDCRHRHLSAWSARYTSLSLNASIAIAANEDLIIVRAHERESDDPEIRKLAAETGLTIKHVFTGKAPPLSELAAFADAFHRVQERLVVATRNVLAPERALSIASSRRIPFLLIAQNESVPMAPQD